MKIKTTVGLCFMGLMVLSTACTKRIPKDALESSVKTVFEQKGLKLKAVACPDGHELKAGDTFDCTAELDEGGKATITVKQTDAKGSLTYDLQGVYIKESEVADALSKEPGGKPDVKCPKKLAVIRKGEHYACDISRGDEKGKIDFTPTDDEQKVSSVVTFEGKPAEPQAVADQQAPAEAPAPVE